MALPKSVQRDLDQAEALQTQLSQAPADTEVITDASQLVAPAAPPPQPPAQAPAPAAEQPPSTESVDYWKSRFSTVQGRYNADVPALQAQTKVQESQINMLMEQVRTLTAAAARPAETPKPTLDPDEVEKYGADMMSMINRHLTTTQSALRTEFGQVLSQLDGRLKQLEGSVQGVSQRTEQSLEAQFWDALAAAHPDYEQVNETDAWKVWLSKMDRMTGVPRQALLDDARKKLDFQRVIGIFSAFKDERPKAPSAAGQVSPASGGAAAAPAASQAPKIISQKFILDFYNDMARGRYVGREAQAAQIEAEINQAAAEHRVR